MVFALDCFTKFPEYDTPPSLDSYHTMAFVHHQLLWRYGIPHKIYVDRGTEFWGEFIRYCKREGIACGLIATLNPHVNGMVECLVGTFKAGVRKCMAACPEGHWWDALPDVARGFCQLQSRAMGLSSFGLQHKQYPELAPAEGMLVNVDEDTSWEEIA